jgi:hypothetical protein
MDAACEQAAVVHRTTSRLKFRDATESPVARTHGVSVSAARTRAKTELSNTELAAQLERRESRAVRRTEVEAKLQAYKAAKANHTDLLAKKEVDAIKKSFEEDRAGRRCPVINPYSKSIQWWESVIMAFLCYQAVELPFRLAFETVFYSASGIFNCRWAE